MQIKGIRLVLIDAILYCLSAIIMLSLGIGMDEALIITGIYQQIAVGLGCVLLIRLLFDVYKQIWRYGVLYSYIRLVVADSLGGVLYYLINRIVLPHKIELTRVIAIISISLIMSIAARMIYYYANQRGREDTKIGKWARILLRAFGRTNIVGINLAYDAQKSRIAIVGAGRVGVALAEDLLSNEEAKYKPICFIDVNKEKIGRELMGIKVIDENDACEEVFRDLGVQTVVFALPQIDVSKRTELFNLYKKLGCDVKTYDYPIFQDASHKKAMMREFDIEELLFRKTVDILNDKVTKYYKDKIVLISGGGGSIGSELARQVARMSPRRIVIVDIYENGAYELQQELRMQYGDKVDVAIEILSVCDKAKLEKVFRTHNPNVVLHAAAHKHVPLMERNVCEAITNNIIGTENMVEISDKYSVGHFIMISTDKAVNPTNVMGATKRFCEMIVMNKATCSKTVFTATRFGNVLGSAGSVIPLFKKQIENGGPVTITDRRIIRYFMTIPEAAQLVLKSGYLAKQGELFVLDMGEPVKIYDMAENLIRLSGYRPGIDIEIVETGLRPGEKMYEELLIKGENLTRTADSKIFIEKEEPIDSADLSNRLNLIVDVALTGDDIAAKEVLKEIIPTYCNR